MAFDGITVAALADEMGRVLTGARIAKITQTESDELIITAKPADAGKPVRLLLSASASLPLAHLTEENRQGPMNAPAFCMLLRKHLQGGRILSVIQPDFERILRFAVEGRDELGDRRVDTLIIELMGKYSNIILIDANDTIIDSIRRVPGSMSSVREVLPGRAYFVPSQNKQSPLELDRQGLQVLLRGRGEPVYKALYGVLRGISPIMAQELCYRAGIDADKSAVALRDDEFERLLAAFLEMAEVIRKKSFTPTDVRLNGQPREYAAIPLKLFEHTPGAQLYPCTSMSALVEGFYREKERLERIGQRSADLRHLVSGALERNRKKLDLQESQLADTKKREKYRLYGELLQAFGYQAEPKARSITVEDYHTGEPVTIPLDPQLNPQENAKRYFDRYQKLKRTEEALMVQTERARQDIGHLESVAQALMVARTEADLREIREELVLSGYLRHHTPAAGKGKARERAVKNPPLHYRTPEGFELFVGKNNLQNDQLTFKLANGGDWWFHAKKLAGSHVILRTGGAELQDIPDRVFERAAALAAWYSTAREQTLAEVDYVRRKEVKKPAGAPPGFVVYYTNYSMNVKPGIDELEEI